MSRLSQPNSLTYGNINTHQYTEFGTLSKESTQKEVLEAIQNINIQVDTSSVLIKGIDGTTERPIVVDSNGKLNVIAECSGSVGVSTAGFKIYDKDGVGFSSTAGTDSKLGLDVNLLNSVLVKGDDYTGTDTTNNLLVNADGSLDVNILNKDGVHENIYLGFENVSTICAGSTSLTNWKSENPYALEDDGFYYNNTVSINDGYLTFYDNQYGTQSNITWGQLSIFYVIMKLYNTNYIPKIFIETNASTVEYNISSGNFLAFGQSYMFYHGQPINALKFNDPECPRILFDKVSAGIPSNSEIIKKVYIKLEGSPTPTNIYKVLIIEGALYMNSSKTLINYYFTSDRQGLSEKNLSNLTFTSNNLNCNINNFPSSQTVSGSVSVSNFPASQTVSGSVSVSNFPSSQTVSGSVSVSNFPASQSVSVSNFPSTVVSLLADTDNTGITSSAISGIANKRFLDTMSDIKVMNSLGGGTNTLVTGSAPNTTKTGLTANSFTTAIDTNAFLSAYNNSTGDIKQLTMSENGGKRSLDVNIVSGGTSSNTVKITDSGGTNFIDVSTTTGGESSIVSKNGIYTNSALYGVDKSTSNTEPINLTVVNTENAINSYLLNPTSSGMLDNKTGLNVYTIPIKYKSYVFSGYGLTANGCMGFNGTSMIHAGGNTQFGYASQFPYMFCTVAKTIQYDYVDVSGALIEGATFNLPANVSTAVPTNSVSPSNICKGILSFIQKSPNYNNENCTLQYGSGPAANYAMGAITSTNYFNGMIYIPNGYIGRITNFYFYANTASVFNVYKRNATQMNFSKCIFQGSGFSSSVIVQPRELGEILYPGDAVFVVRPTTATDSYFYSNVILEPY